MRPRAVPFTFRHTMTATPQDIPGCVTFQDGNGDLPKVEVKTRWSDAEVYLHGAHITHFQRRGEPPLLFMSPLSRFETGVPIRGGIPIIFPWFGSREGHAAHGFARTTSWDLRQVVPQANGEVTLKFVLPDCAQASLFPRFSAEYRVTIGPSLKAELAVTNVSGDQELAFEDCLHTYFHVGEISAVSIRGLRGADYLDKVSNFARKTEALDAIRITSETDRIYLDTESIVEIDDRSLGRTIVVAKSGSRSTVLWNPWIAKSLQMPDFGNQDYQRMVCVESGNVSENRICLLPGQTQKLQIELSIA